LSAEVALGVLVGLEALLEAVGAGELYFKVRCFCFQVLLTL
jgi:hypothetical protein